MRNHEESECNRCILDRTKFSHYSIPNSICIKGSGAVKRNHAETKKVNGGKPILQLKRSESMEYYINYHKNDKIC